MTSPKLFRTVCLALCGVAVLAACKDFLPKRPLRAHGQAAEDVPNTPEEQFRDARLTIMEGRPDKAAATLRKLVEAGKTPAPTRQWITLFAGLAELLAGKEEASRPFFAKLAKDASAGKSGKFFLEIGERLAGDKVIKVSESRDLDRFNYQALGLWMYGLKAENLGDFEEALTFYRQFTTSLPRDAEPWPGFNSYFHHSLRSAMKTLEYEDKLDTAQRQLRITDKPDAAAEGNRAVEAAKVARRVIKHQSKLIVSLDETMKTLEGTSGEQLKTLASDMEGDAKALPDAKAKWKALTDQFKFVEAKEAILEPKFKTADAIKEQDLLALRTGYLEQFKFYLIQELALTGYKKPVTLRDGTSIKGGVAKVDDITVFLRDGDKEKAVPWVEVAPESIFAMATSLITPEEPKDAAGFRKWHLGNFAAFIGKNAEARKILTEAAKLNPSYEGELEAVLAGIPPA